MRANMNSGEPKQLNLIGKFFTRETLPAFSVLLIAVVLGSHTSVSNKFMVIYICAYFIYINLTLIKNHEVYLVSCYRKKLVNEILEPIQVFAIKTPYKMFTLLTEYNLLDQINLKDIADKIGNDLSKCEEVKEFQDKINHFINEINASQFDPCDLGTLKSKIIDAKNLVEIYLSKVACIYYQKFNHAFDTPHSHDYSDILLSKSWRKYILTKYNSILEELIKHHVCLLPILQCHLNKLFILEEQPEFIKISEITSSLVRDLQWKTTQDIQNSEEDIRFFLKN